MWVMLSDAFLSIVHKECGPDELLVRSRRKGDIEKVFPGAKVKRTPGSDYLFRAVIERSEVAAKMAEAAMAVDYGNFKNSVKDNKLHSALSRVWSVMAGLQSVAPYSTQRARRSKQKPLFSTASPFDAKEMF